ncbi:MAG: hypothetical protein AAGJ83_09525 [Planctomycetota bacterium]
MASNPPARRGETDEPVLRSRLLPRVSFRTILLLMTASALVFAVAYSADQGGKYAMGFSAGIGFLLSIFAFSAVVFVVAWAIAIVPRIVGFALVGGGLIMAGLNVINTTVAWIWIIDALAIGLFLTLFPFVSRRKEHSPFATDELPPQHLAPRDPTL